MIRKFLFLILIVLSTSAQAVFTNNDIEICKTKFNLAFEKDLFEKPINEVIIEIGKSFLGLDYEAHTLEKGVDEKLVVHLSGLDCYTFLEASLVFARCIKLGDTTFGCFQKELENIRYRNGKLDEYPSRLHYFSDWIFDMNKRGIAKDITQDIGGIPYQNNVNFMSTHPDSYMQLNANPAFTEEIEKIEKEISARDYFYIPEDKIKLIEENIESGDILGITTNIKGLDISHTGIAIRLDDGRIHLLHAPNVGKQIEISEKPLAEYIQSIKQQTGIMVVRPLEIRK
ncbi:MAG: DUF1460 domain-containing protein [Melioribacteraceae bacterium]|nr:DUF1460 domain-containing protein [Melioribacteraceae bacterium]